MDANPESLPTFLIGISLFKQALPCLKKHQTLLELCFRNGRFLTEHMQWKVDKHRRLERMQSMAHPLFA
jgi:hypothetical protein